MRAILLTALFLILAFCFRQQIYSQPDFFEEFNNRFSELSLEKVYLHTDRNMYSSNEDMWFKIYLVNAKIHIPVAGINTVYVNITNSESEILMHKPFLVLNGIGFGDIIISDSLIPAGILYMLTRII